MRVLHPSSVLCLKGGIAQTSTEQHRNPVRCRLVAKPEHLLSSSFVHYAAGKEGAIEIESQWTAMRGKRQRKWRVDSSAIPPLRDETLRKDGAPSIVRERRMGHPPGRIVATHHHHHQIAVDAWVASWVRL